MSCLHHRSVFSPDENVFLEQIFSMQFREMFLQNIEEFFKLIQAYNQATELKPLYTDQVLLWLVISVQEKLVSHVSLCLDSLQIKEDFRPVFGM